MPERCRLASGGSRSAHRGSRTARGCFAHAHAVALNALPKSPAPPRGSRSSPGEFPHFACPSCTASVGPHTPPLESPAPRSGKVPHPLGPHPRSTRGGLAGPLPPAATYQAPPGSSPLSHNSEEDGGRGVALLERVMLPRHRRRGRAGGSLLLPLGCGAAAEQVLRVPRIPAKWEARLLPSRFCAATVPSIMQIMTTRRGSICCRCSTADLLKWQIYDVICRLFSVRCGVSPHTLQREVASCYDAPKELFVQDSFLP